MLFNYKPQKNNDQLLVQEDSIHISSRLANLQDQYTSFKNNTNISNNQCTITCNNLLKFCEAKLLTKFRLKLNCTKTIAKPTIAAASGAMTVTGSSQYVLGADNFTVVPGSINNMITKISVNTNKQNYVYENTSDGAQKIMRNRISLMQYDQKKINNEFKLHVDKDIEDNVDYDTILGLGSTTQENVFAGFLNVYGTRQKTLQDSATNWLLERNSSYCILDKKQQLNISNYKSEKGDGTAVVMTIEPIGLQGYGELIHGTAADYPLVVTQVAYVDVYEYLMAPFLSTDYDPDQMIKVFKTNNNMDITLNYDSSMLNGIVKVSSDINVTSVTVEEVEIKRLHSFSTLGFKQIELGDGNLQSLSYNFGASLVPSSNTTNLKIVDAQNDGTYNEVYFSQQNVFNMPKYLVIGAPAKLYTATKANRTSSLLFGEIQELRLDINAETSKNVLEYITMRELEQMTADVLQNDKEWFKYIDSSYRKTMPSVNSVLSKDTQNINNTLYGRFTSGGKPQITLQDGAYTPTRRQKLNFFILDLTRISLGSIDGVPLVPGVMYNTPFSYKLTQKISQKISTFDYEQLIKAGSSVDYQCVPMCIPVTTVLGRLSASGNYEMIELTQSYENFASTYMKALDTYNIVFNRRVLFGGRIAEGFFGDLWDDIKTGVSDVANVVKKVVPVVAQALPVVEQVASHLGGRKQIQFNDSKRMKRYI